MAIVRPLGSTSSSSSKSDGWDDVWGGVKDVAKGAVKGAAKAVGKKLGIEDAKAPAPVVYMPPPEPKKEAFHETTLGKVVIIAGIAKLMKVW